MGILELKSIITEMKNSCKGLTFLELGVEPTHLYCRNGTEGGVSPWPKQPRWGGKTMCQMLSYLRKLSAPRSHERLGTPLRGNCIFFFLLRR